MNKILCITLIHINALTKMKTNRLKAAIESKLKARTTEQLKNDAISAMAEDSHGANLIFVTALNILESRLSPEEYTNFENSL